MKTYIGIDNGPTGSVGIIGPHGCEFLRIPSKRELSYTKAAKHITRIDWVGLRELLSPVAKSLHPVFVSIERPMVNPSMFTATGSALRALEAVLIVVEMLELPYRYIDSREWQKVLLPEGIKGPPALKAASMEIGCRLFPDMSLIIKKQKDADGLLIAEYCRRAGF